MKKTVATASAALLVSMALTGNPQAGPPDRHEISAGQYEQIRAVGRVVLHAKRAAREEDDSRIFRAELGRISELVDQLTMPLIPDRTKISIQIEAESSLQAGENIPLPKTWHEARSTQINTLKQATDSIGDRSWLYASREATMTNSRHPVTPGGLERLKSLNIDIDQALALPPQERMGRLEALADALTLQKQHQSVREREPGETPTIISRTTHRRAGSR